MVNTNCCGGCRIFVPVLSKGSLEPMGELFMEDGTAGDWCDNVLLEWTAGLELLARNHVKAVMPIIGTLDLVLFVFEYTSHIVSQFGRGFDKHQCLLGANIVHFLNFVG